MTLSTHTSGDAALIEGVQTSLEANGSGHNWDKVAFTLVDLNASQTVRHALFGVDKYTGFELASVTKTMVGHLFAVAIKAGACSPDDHLNTYLPVTGGLGDITLSRLARHLSGLQRNYVGWTPFIGPDTPIDDIEQLCGLAEDVWTLTPGNYQYSSIGTAMLGQAIAAALGTDFVSAMRDLVFEPFGMHSTYIPYSNNDLPVPPLLGRDADTGLAFPARSLHLLAPASGVRSNAADMGRYMRKIMLGTAPGIGAIRPRDQVVNDGDTIRIGWFWRRTLSLNSISHTGALNGFRSYVLIGRSQRRGVCILSNTDHGAHTTVAQDILINWT